MTKDIQKAIAMLEIEKGNIVTENFNYFFIGELDVVSLNKSGYVSEFEVKISRSDFKADSKKRKWYFFDNKIEKQIPNYFWYACPDGLIMPHEIKPYMGLIYYSEKGFIVIQKPKIIHKFKHDVVKLLTKIARQNNWKQYFGACQLTVKNNEIKERNKEITHQKIN